MTAASCIQIESSDGDERSKVKLRACRIPEDIESGLERGKLLLRSTQPALRKSHGTGKGRKGAILRDQTTGTDEITAAIHHHSPPLAPTSAFSIPPAAAGRPSRRRSTNPPPRERKTGKTSTEAVRLTNPNEKIVRKLYGHQSLAWYTLLS